MFDHIVSKIPFLEAVKGTKLLDLYLKELLQKQGRRIFLSQDNSCQKVKEGKNKEGKSKRNTFVATDQLVSQ